jgi:solute:Na+ symporter, SSS family
MWRFSTYARDIAENMYRALWSCLICAVVTVVVGMATKPRPNSELNGLVYGVRPKFPRRCMPPPCIGPWFWAAVVGTIFVILNIIFL